jgi:hypothetical protein
VSFIYNHYNQRDIVLEAENSTSSWSYTSTSWRESNNGTGQTRIEVLSGESQEVDVHLGQGIDANGGIAYVGVALDRTTGQDGQNITSADTVRSTISISSRVSLPTGGYHYITTVEHGGSGGTETFYGGNFMSCTVKVRG